MDTEILLRVLASIIAASAPLVFASIGETITEKAGVINLSLDGSIMLAAMAAFAIAFITGNVWLGVLAALIVGALVALIIAIASIELRLDQVAVGFVLALLCIDLSSFLGNPFVRQPGPSVSYAPLPFLKDIPILGALFFDHDWLIYASFVLIFAAWFWFYKTQPGLLLQGIGEQPAAAFARGANVKRLRYFYTLIGGALVGLAGAAYSLDVKQGWSYQHTAGNGWIALAIVIFGSWHPLRAAFGAYLFGALQTASSLLQGVLPDVPTQALTVAPFALMIVFLLITSSDALERFLALLPRTIQRALRNALRGAPPAALGTVFEEK